jgi:hypothetical protein
MKTNDTTSSTHDDDVIDATFVVVDTHDASDCDDSCSCCAVCYRRTGDDVCDRLCDCAHVDVDDCDVLINLRHDDSDVVDSDDDSDVVDDECSDCGCDLAKGRHHSECSEPDDVEAICARRGHSFDSPLNLDGGRCRRCGVRR